ncbi:TonB-linked outer membrane protein, SusC/RagA family [bacterium A37T11]|nr:TonB-linked outer membrane protein, SusC/RagA family [bacterium A37T11]
MNKIYFYRVMRLLLCFLLGGFLTVSAASYSQTVTLKGTHLPLATVLEAVRQQTGYEVAGNKSMLKNSKNITISAENMPLEGFLDQVFSDQPLTYRLVDKNILLEKKKESFLDIFLPSRHSGPAEGSLQQTITVIGRVTDSLRQPIAGATIRVKNGNSTSSSGSNGQFILNNVPIGTTLQITAMGYQPKELPAKAQMGSIVLHITQSALDEVQIIAYGTTSRRLSTGNISSISAEDIAKQPVQNPLLALQGRIPGLVVTQNTGLAGGGVTVRLQGQNSIYTANGNDPLIVVDGMPYPSQTLRFSGADILKTSGGGVGNTGNGSPLNYLNPSTIESITVLKDADATAIYGSRAANGAIIITTKKGLTGPTRLTADYQQGWGTIAKKLDLMNTSQYLEMRREAFKNDGLTVPSISTTPTNTDYDVNGLWDTTRYTDWQKVLIGGTAKTTSANASVSGGNDLTKFLFGGTYFKQTTVFPGDFKDQKGSANFSLSNTSKNQRYKLQLSTSYLYDKNILPTTDFTASTIFLAPNAPALYKADGTLNWAPRPSGVGSWTNPMGTLLNHYENTTKTLLSNAAISYQVVSGLIVLANLGYNYLNIRDFTPTLAASVDPSRLATFSRSVTSSNSTISSWIVEPQINYKKNLGPHSFDMLLGGTIQRKNSNNLYTASYGYSSDLLIRSLSSATTVYNTPIDLIYRYSALFTRLNYSYRKKYILNLTARRDGSSRFGPDSRFHSFGAVGAAWIFSEESFVKDNIGALSFGKIRGSYGTTGNDQIPDYQYYSLFQNLTIGVPYQGIATLTVSNLYNPLLQWESTRKLSLGIDLGFWKDRIIAGISYSKNRSSNQLLPYSLPSFVGFTSITSNFPATVQNTIWEFSIQTYNIKRRSFSWNSSLNFTSARNKLAAFPNLASSSYGSTLVIGQPLSITKNYNLHGVNPATGLYQFITAKGELTSSPAYGTDRTVVVNTAPTFYGGFQNTIQYKGIQLDVFFQFVKQKAYSNDDYFRGSMGSFQSGSNNQPTYALERWQKEGDIKPIQKYSTTSANETISGYALNSGITDASFVRLKNLSISYLLPKEVNSELHFQNLKVFIQAQNLWTFTGYKGLDPESLKSAIPPLRTINLGIQATL